MKKFETSKPVLQIKEGIKAFSELFLHDKIVFEENFETRSLKIKLLDPLHSKPQPIIYEQGSPALNFRGFGLLSPFSVKITFYAHSDPGTTSTDCSFEEQDRKIFVKFTLR